MNRIKSEPGSDPVMFWKEGKRFIKMFVAVRAMIAPFAIMKKGFFAEERDIFDDGRAIIVNQVCFRAAVRTGESFAFHGEMDMNFGIREIEFRNDSIFQSEEFCSKISSRHRVHSFL